MRPRFVGWGAFEKRAGDRMEAMLREAAPTSAIVDMILAEAARLRDGEVGPPFDVLLGSDPGPSSIGDVA